MSTFGRLVVYVTSHGFGHLNRTVAVLNRLPVELPITIRCAGDLAGHWKERLLRPAQIEEYVSDLGVVGPPGDSATTDGPATLDGAARLHGAALYRLAEEAAWLWASGAAAVLCDAPWVPLAAAAEAGVPGFVLANFLWSEIYAEHAEALGQPYRDFVQEVRACYRCATAVFRAEPALPLRDIAQRIDVGMVLTPGRDRRAELRAALGIERGRKVVSLYVGRSGQDNLPWERLARFADVTFVSYHVPPVAVPNLHVVAVQDWNGADLAASVDVAVAKAGYGAVCEAMASGTPLIYPPRGGFAEFACLDEALRAWGGGVPVTAAEFAELELGPALERAFQSRPGTPPFLAGGAARVADALLAACRRE